MFKAMTSNIVSGKAYTPIISVKNMPIAHVYQAQFKNTVNSMLSHLMNKIVSAKVAWMLFVNHVDEC